MKSKINLVQIYDEAYRDKKSVSLEQYQERVKNMVSHAFVVVEREFSAYCRANGYSYDEDTFYAVQKVLVAVMVSDGDILVGEYDAYCKVCKWANIKALSAADCRALYNRTTAQDLSQAIDLIKCCRSNMDSSDYRLFVLALCYLSLLGDNCVDESEWRIIKQFCEPGYDYCPSTWSQFEYEYKNY